MSEIMLKVFFIFFGTIIIKVNCEDPLILTPLIESGKIEEARKLSRVDPQKFLDIKSHSGFITVQPQYDSNLFFWYFPHEDLRKPWVIWLNGGPGVSSLYGLFNLIGPFEVVNMTLQRRNINWRQEYSLLFIDNPVGAGFSFTKNEAGYTSNEEQVGDQLYVFLQQFLEVFPELRSLPLFIAGESYAGKYIPALGLYIHQNKGFGEPINLKGLSMGNALVDLKYMFPHYTDLVRETGLLADEQLEELKRIEVQGLDYINEGKMVDASNKFNETIEYIKKKTGANVYNYIENPWTLQSDFEEFVKSPKVRKEIHVGDAEFNLNNQVVYNNMLSDIANSSKPFVEELLEEYGIMFYNGQLDLVVPYSLTKRLIGHLQWSKKEQFLNSTRKRFYDSQDKTVVGYKKCGGNLVEVLVRSCGHMAPQERPEVIKYLIDAFIEQFK